MSEENGIIGIKFGNNTFNFSGSIGEKGETGPQGPAGEDGRSVTNTEINQDGELVITFSDNTESNLGVVVGEDGTPITIESIVESDEDGGENVVYFSDGSELTVKNGKTGAGGGTGGTSYTAGTGINIDNNNAISINTVWFEEQIDNVAGIKIASGDYDTTGGFLESDDTNYYYFDIDVGFQPKVVYISVKKFLEYDPSGTQTTKTVLINDDWFTFLENGFRVRGGDDGTGGNSNTEYFKSMELSDDKYYWVAIG